MYKDYRYINAGQNEIYRYGRKAREKVEKYLDPSNGFYSIPVDGENIGQLERLKANMESLPKLKIQYFP